VREEVNQAPVVQGSGLVGVALVIAVDTSRRRFFGSMSSGKCHTVICLSCAGTRPRQQGPSGRVLDMRNQGTAR
jgi:hypothetical protein